MNIWTCLKWKFGVKYLFWSLAPVSPSSGRTRNKFSADCRLSPLIWPFSLIYPLSAHSLPPSSFSAAPSPCFPSCASPSQRVLGPVRCFGRRPTRPICRPCLCLCICANVILLYFIVVVTVCHYRSCKAGSSGLFYSAMIIYSCQKDKPGSAT